MKIRKIMGKIGDNTASRIVALGIMLMTFIPLAAQTRIVGDVAVADMVDKHIELNARVKTIPGFRVQIASFSGANAKNSAFETKRRFEEAFPEVQAYIAYDEPNFRVKVGDFRTRLEAYAFHQRVGSMFKGLIVRDNINPEPPETIDFAPDDETSGDE